MHHSNSNKSADDHIPSFRDAASFRTTHTLEETLQQIVQDVVEALGYIGSMVATYEHGDTLPVRAIYVDPQYATLDQIRNWEREVSKLTRRPVKLTDPRVARTVRYDEAYQDNLSIRAAEAGKPVTSDELYDLFVPIAPPATRPIVLGIQKALRIKQVIAVPFFIGDEMVGNLFAAKQAPIADTDVHVLSAFGRQAAAAIQGARQALQLEVAHDLVYVIQANLENEALILQRIVEGVVSELDYIGALIMTHEQDRSLPVRAAHIDPEVADSEQMARWEQAISEQMGQPIRLTDPGVAVVYRHQVEYANNLGIQAAEAGSPVTSKALFDPRLN
jgi:GAF domain-containing protein